MIKGREATLCRFLFMAINRKLKTRGNKKRRNKERFVFFPFCYFCFPCGQFSNVYVLFKNKNTTGVNYYIQCAIDRMQYDERWCNNKEEKRHWAEWKRGERERNKKQHFPLDSTVTLFCFVFLLSLNETRAAAAPWPDTSESPKRRAHTGYAHDTHTNTHIQKYSRRDTSVVVVVVVEQ